MTNAIHKLQAGDKVGVRAPLGNWFPYEQWKGKNVFFVGGGIGMAPIRTILLHLLEHAGDYGQISLLYGATGRVVIRRHYGDIQLTFWLYYLHQGDSS